MYDLRNNNEVECGKNGLSLKYEKHFRMHIWNKIRILSEKSPHTIIIRKGNDSFGRTVILILFRKAGDDAALL